MKLKTLCVDEELIRALVEEWRVRLYLGEWKIETLVGDDDEFECMAPRGDGTFALGETEPDISHRTATIYIRKTWTKIRMLPGKDLAYMVEKTVVHELLHLKLAWFDSRIVAPTDGHINMIDIIKNEATVEDLAGAFMAVKYLGGGKRASAPKMKNQPGHE